MEDVKYESVIGLEIHAELNTRTKMFCACLNDPDEKHPNTNICPVCMGHPGTLPTANEEAIKKVILVGLAINGTIAQFSQFDRKNYFYPDLPKGYQISQYPHPLVSGGHLEIQVAAREPRKIRINRIHLEEDTGRLIHDGKSGGTLVDFNRAGVPLMELVTEPDLRTAEEVQEFGERLRDILRYTNVSHADMEKGQMRVEVNLSVRERGARQFGTKVEVKNINSFRYAADAARYEKVRQIELVKNGEAVKQETRGWNEYKHQSISQRSKEQAHDYRYFPEPDIPPLTLSLEYIEKIREMLPELPEAKRIRFVAEYKIDTAIAEILVKDKSLADFFEASVSEALQHESESGQTSTKDITKTVGAFLTGDFLRLLRESGSSVAELRMKPEHLAELAMFATQDKVSNLGAKQALEAMFHSGDDAHEAIERLGLWQISDTGDLENVVQFVIKENSKAVDDYRQGKAASLQFLLGQIMKETRGKANPKVVQEILERILN